MAPAWGMGAAIAYGSAIGADRIAAHEHDVLRYATDRLSAVPGLTIHGTAPGKASIVSFSIAGAHPHDLATLVDRSGVAIRAGHHCAQTLMHLLEVVAPSRSCVALDNHRSDERGEGTGCDR